MILVHVVTAIAHGFAMFLIALLAAIVVATLALSIILALCGTALFALRRYLTNRTP